MFCSDSPVFAVAPVSADRVFVVLFDDLCCEDYAVVLSAMAVAGASSRFDLSSGLECVGDSTARTVLAGSEGFEVSLVHDAFGTGSHSVRVQGPADRVAAFGSYAGDIPLQG